MTDRWARMKLRTLYFEVLGFHYASITTKSAAYGYYRYASTHTRDRAIREAAKHSFIREVRSLRAAMVENLADAVAVA